MTEKDGRPTKVVRIPQELYETLSRYAELERQSVAWFLEVASKNFIAEYGPIFEARGEQLKKIIKGK